MKKRVERRRSCTKIEALQKNKVTRSVTTEVASILNKEPSLNPEQMRGFIDDIFSIQNTAVKKEFIDQ